MSSDAPVAVHAKLRCPDKYRIIVERAMAAMPPAWRLAPRLVRVLILCSFLTTEFAPGRSVMGSRLSEVVERVSGLDCAYGASTTARRFGIRGSLRITW